MQCGLVPIDPVRRVMSDSFARYNITNAQLTATLRRIAVPVLTSLRDDKPLRDWAGWVLVGPGRPWHD